MDGGFSLQYSPLMEYRQGKGMVIFCQMDVTGRTQTDPAAETLTANILEYVSEWKPSPRREAVYVGDPAGGNHLESAGVSLGSYDNGNLSLNQVLVVGPGGGQKLAGRVAEIANWLRAGGHVLAIGLEQEDANVLLPFKVAMTKAEHISACFEPFGMDSLLAGIGPADVHNRDPRELPLVSGGAKIVGDGVLAKMEDANILFCQLVPWQFDGSKQFNLKRTYRRASFLVSRLLANMGVAGSTPLLDRFHHVGYAPHTAKFRKWYAEICIPYNGLYLDQPEEWDDPYRFFRW